MYALRCISTARVCNKLYTSNNIYTLTDSAFILVMQSCDAKLMEYQIIEIINKSLHIVSLGESMMSPVGC